ncbi:TIGR04076 family protein, partial [Candidatus Bathyarchaeota archaeon]|nr:TIGR04076 family protein [Candidatus Bathyarchaeota archaeon]
MTRIKINVVKGFTVEEVFQDESPDHLPDDFTSPCPVHLEGQEFILDNSLGCPAGFCSWAFRDIYRDLIHLMRGGDYPWIGTPSTSYS